MLFCPASYASNCPLWGHSSPDGRERLLNISVMSKNTEREKMEQWEDGDNKGSSCATLP